MSDFLIWDVDGPPSLVDGTVILWRGFCGAHAANCISIPEIVEENAERLRALYLASIYELGEVRVRDVRLIDHLRVRDGLSFWWLTSLVEKCNFAKSPQIEDSIRFLAFADWAEKNSLDRLVLVTANRALAECFRAWCRKSCVSFDWQYHGKSARQRPWSRKLYSVLPLSIQALAWLTNYVFDRWPLRGVGLERWRKSTAGTTFVTYSDNCDGEALLEGRYSSRYWAHLPSVLQSAGRETNWLHIYVEDTQLPNARYARVTFNRLNTTLLGNQCHVTLDTFMGLSVLLRTVRDWLSLKRIGRRLNEEFTARANARFDFWPLLQNDWRTSLFGADAINKILFLNLFEIAIKLLPKQSRGVYLQENMSWEVGFINAWRSARHGQLIGTPHSIVRFWDLRYFYDPRTYQRGDSLCLPLPDTVACNGPVARTFYQQGGFPAHRLADVEALRYLHLARKSNNFVKVENLNQRRCLLVLGDYLDANNRLQLGLLEKAVKLYDLDFDITVKSHPNSPICAPDYPGIRFSVSTMPVEGLIGEFDLVYVSAMTSAGIDAFCSGASVICVQNPNTLNLSPLRDCSEVLFVRTPDELGRALRTPVELRRSRNAGPTFFTLDDRLHRWRELLA